MESKAFIDIDKKNSLIDESINIVVNGLKPKDKIKITAYSPDFYRFMKKGILVKKFVKQVEWSSFGIFEANNEGKVDLSIQKPIKGTYNCIDSMGIFWSMKHKKIIPYNLSENLSEIPLLNKMKVIFTVEMNGKIICRNECNRLFYNENVQVEAVTQDGLVARFFNIQDDIKKPGIIVLSGSEGSIYKAQKLAGIFASHGYAALALGYFNMNNLNRSLENIPIEYVEKAVRWMKENKCVDSDKIIIYGRSKGGELALLAGCHINDVHGIIATVPSPIHFEGLNSNGINGGQGSWSYKNQTYPFLKLEINRLAFAFKCFYNVLRNKPIPLNKLYKKVLQDSEKVKKAFMPIEKINGPMLLISASNDYIWPSKELCDMAIERLKKSDFTYDYKHVSYKAGHFIFLPYEPIIKCDISDEKIAYADKDSFDNVLNFLEKFK